MKDKLNNKLSIGDKVAFAPGGSYSGISIGEIVKFTEKQVGIRAINGGKGRHILGGSSKKRLYYTNSETILKINY